MPDYSLGRVVLFGGNTAQSIIEHIASLSLAVWKKEGEGTQKREQKDKNLSQSKLGIRMELRCSEDPRELLAGEPAIPKPYKASRPV